MMPIGLPSRATSTGVRPAAPISSSRSWIAGEHRPPLLEQPVVAEQHAVRRRRALRRRGPPARSRRPPARPRCARPPRSCRIACAMGCVGPPLDRRGQRDNRGRAGAVQRRRRRRPPARRASACRSCRTRRSGPGWSRSRCTPPLISTPLRAAPASAATIDTGVEMTSAHGHETTSRTSAR